MKFNTLFDRFCSNLRNEKCFIENVVVHRTYGSTDRSKISFGRMLMSFSKSFDFIRIPLIGFGKMISIQRVDTIEYHRQRLLTTFELFVEDHLDIRKVTCKSIRMNTFDVMIEEKITMNWFDVKIRIFLKHFHRDAANVPVKK